VRADRTDDHLEVDGNQKQWESIARFSADGLWSHRAVRFSRFGTLLDTAKALVDHSEAGYTAAELDRALHVETRRSLVQLVRTKQLRREKFQSSYVYFAPEAKKHRSQRKRRERLERRPLATVVVTNPDLAEDEAKAVVLLFRVFVF
jgi:hypothetical protein